MVTAKITYKSGDTSVVTRVNHFDMMLHIYKEEDLIEGWEYTSETM